MDGQILIVGVPVGLLLLQIRPAFLMPAPTMESVRSMDFFAEDSMASFRLNSSAH